MKKQLALLTLVFMDFCLFAQTFPNNIKEILAKSNLVCFSKSEAIKEQKPYIELFCSSKEEFIKTKTSNPWVKRELFPDLNNITYSDLIKTYKDGQYLYVLPSWQYEKYLWRKGKTYEYSIIYSINTYYPINGSGVYIFTIFDSDYVYIIAITDEKILDEQDNEYNALNDIFEFREGNKLDKQKGLEQTQGYYCSEKSAAIFYDKLQNNDSALPKGAQNFQKAKIFIETVLDNY